MPFSTIFKTIMTFFFLCRQKLARRCCICESGSSVICGRCDKGAAEVGDVYFEEFKINFFKTSHKPRLVCCWQWITLNRNSRLLEILTGFFWGQSIQRITGEFYLCMKFLKNTTYLNIVVIIDTVCSRSVSFWNFGLYLLGINLFFFFCCRWVAIRNPSNRWISDNEY